MINPIWLTLLLIGIITGLLTDHLEAITTATFDACKIAMMNIALPLAGVMALWLGIMRLAEKSGSLQKLASFLRPLLVRLFPDIPPHHPAMGSIVMNIAANMLGLGNAATPLGLRAMQDLEKLNPHPGVATNAMCTFLAINTSSIQLIPVTAIGILAAAGATHPTAIISTALIASLCSCITGITAAKILQRLPAFKTPAPDTSITIKTPPLASSSTFELCTPSHPLSFWGKGILLLFITIFIGTGWRLVAHQLPLTSPFLAFLESLSLLAIPFLLGFFSLYAHLRGVPVYEEFVEGAKEGFHVVLRIFPYLVAILVAIGIFRAAGCITFLSHLLAPLLNHIGLPSELLPLIFVRPLSGSAATGCFAEIVKSAGPNSFLSQLAGTILGGTETTLYVLAVYFGSIAIKRGRHALAVGLIADTAGVVAALLICHWMWPQ